MLQSFRCLFMLQIYQTLQPVTRQQDCSEAMQALTGQSNAAQPCCCQSVPPRQNQLHPSSPRQQCTDRQPVTVGHSNASNISPKPGLPDTLQHISAAAAGLQDKGVGMLDQLAREHRQRVQAQRAVVSSHDRTPEQPKASHAQPCRSLDRRPASVASHRQAQAGLSVQPDSKQAQPAPYVALCRIARECQDLCPTGKTGQWQRKGCRRGSIADLWYKAASHAQ